MSAESSINPSILVFDGVCVLCSGWVRFLLARDRENRFRFAAMQSTVGRALLAEHGLDPDDPTSLLLIESGVAWTDTDAIRRVLNTLGGPWRLASASMVLLPRLLRDPLYRLVARNRYRWFGRHKVCMMPSTETEHRFLGR